MFVSVLITETAVTALLTNVAGNRVVTYKSFPDGWTAIPTRPIVRKQPKIPAQLVTVATGIVPTTPLVAVFLSLKLH